MNIWPDSKTDITWELPIDESTSCSSIRFKVVKKASKSVILSHILHKTPLWRFVVKWAVEEKNLLHPSPINYKASKQSSSSIISFIPVTAIIYPLKSRNRFVILMSRDQKRDRKQAENQNSKRTRIESQIIFVSQLCFCLCFNFNFRIWCHERTPFFSFLLFMFLGGTGRVNENRNNSI